METTNLAYVNDESGLCERRICTPLKGLLRVKSHRSLSTDSNHIARGSRFEPKLPLIAAPLYRLERLPSRLRRNCFLQLTVALVSLFTLNCHPRRIVVPPGRKESSRVETDVNGIATGIAANYRVDQSTPF